VEILGTQTVKNELRSLLVLAGTNPERPIIRNRFDNFYRHAATSLAGHCSVTLKFRHTGAQQAALSGDSI